MPGYDGSGPMGQGPMTGGARGYCSGSARPLGLGMGRGRGRGNRNQYYATGLPAWARNVQPGQMSPSVSMSKEQEKEMLSQQLKAIQERMDALDKTE